MPEDVGEYPKIEVTLALLQRRWRKHRKEVLSQSVRTLVGAGGFLAIAGLAIPFFVLFTDPVEYNSTLDLVSLPAWMISGALGSILIGVVVGFSMGFAVGITVDACA